MITARGGIHQIEKAKMNFCKKMNPVSFQELIKLLILRGIFITQTNIPEDIFVFNDSEKHYIHFSRYLLDRIHQKLHDINQELEFKIFE